MLHIQKNDINLKFNNIAKIIQSQIANTFDNVLFDSLFLHCNINFKT